MSYIITYFSQKYFNLIDFPLISKIITIILAQLGAIGT
jgi:hypothetical protein